MIFFLNIFHRRKGSWSHLCNSSFIYCCNLFWTEGCDIISFLLILISSFCPKHLLLMHAVRWSKRLPIWWDFSTKSSVRSAVPPNFCIWSNVWSIEIWNYEVCLNSNSFHCLSNQVMLLCMFSTSSSVGHHTWSNRNTASNISNWCWNLARVVSRSWTSIGFEWVVFVDIHTSWLRFLT